MNIHICEERHPVLGWFDGKNDVRGVSEDYAIVQGDDYYVTATGAERLREWQAGGCLRKGSTIFATPEGLEAHHG